jgi:RNA recognition motif-containing protein
MWVIYLKKLNNFMSNLLTLYIGNLNPNTNAEILGKLLEECGPVFAFLLLI